jgi:hypothetical protein
MSIYGWAQHLPDQKKPFVKDELEKLIAGWPTEVVKRQKKDKRKVRYLIIFLLVTLRLGINLTGECVSHYLFVMLSNTCCFSELLVTYEPA